MTAPKSNVDVVFGAMTFGLPGFEGVRTTDPKQQSEILDILQAHGHNEIDTARIYGGNTSEASLAALKPSYQERGILMDTKLYPRTSLIGAELNDHTPAGVRLGLDRSLKALNTDKLHLFYLHAPDRQVPFEDTLRVVNDMYIEGKFERFGLSNFMSWEVAQVCEICIRNNWIRPTAYQGVYSALQRAIDAELMPCIRHYGLSFYGFAPLAGGVLTGKFQRDQTSFEKGGRYDPDTMMGKFHNARYFNDPWFDALDIIKPVADKHQLTIAECALRWLQHHSSLSRKYNDKVIIGASSAAQLESNLLDLEKGPLPEEVVQALDAGWQVTAGLLPKYYLVDAERAKIINSDPRMGIISGK